MAILITFDMDGTLLAPDLSITKKTIDAIHKCADQGKIIALCTGRSVAELREYLPELLPSVRYASCVSGALCWDLLENKKLCSSSMSPETVLKALEIAKPFSPLIHFLSDYSILQESHWRQLSNYNMGIHTEAYQRVSEFVEDINVFYKNSPQPIEKLNFYNRSEEDRERLEHELAKANLPVELKHAELTSLELSPKNVTKGTGLLGLCKYLGIDPKETISVGDAENDVDAFRVSGMGIAMGNAPDSVKAQADFVTSDNAHDGCALAIEKYMLC